MQLQGLKASSPLIYFSSLTSYIWDLEDSSSRCLGVICLEQAYTYTRGTERERGFKGGSYTFVAIHDFGLGPVLPRITENISSKIPG